MNLEIQSVFDAGDHGMEHVLLRARAACSLGRFLLANGSAGDDPGETHRLLHCYWFPDAEIDAGDYVSVWTKAGKDTVCEMNNGAPIYRYYWGLENPVWSKKDTSVLLFDLRMRQEFRLQKK